MSNYPEGVLEDNSAPFNEKSYYFSFNVICYGALPNDKYFHTEVDSLKAGLKEAIEGLKDFGEIQIKEV